MKFAPSSIVTFTTLFQNFYFGILIHQKHRFWVNSLQSTFPRLVLFKWVKIKSFPSLLSTCGKNMPQQTFFFCVFKILPRDTWGSVVFAYTGITLIFSFFSWEALLCPNLVFFTLNSDIMRSPVEDKWASPLHYPGTGFKGLYYFPNLILFKMGYPSVLEWGEQQLIGVVGMGCTSQWTGRERVGSDRPIESNTFMSQTPLNLVECKSKKADGYLWGKYINIEIMHIVSYRDSPPCGSIYILSCFKMKFLQELIVWKQHCILQVTRKLIT